MPLLSASMVYLLSKGLNTNPAVSLLTLVSPLDWKVRETDYLGRGTSFRSFDHGDNSSGVLTADLGDGLSLCLEAQNIMLRL